MSEQGPAVVVEGGAPVRRPGSVAPGWLAWPLVVLCALPLVLGLELARRVLDGTAELFGSPPPEPFPLRERVLILVQVVGVERNLVVPLLGLAGLAWWALHVRGSCPLPAAALRAGAAVAAAVSAASAAMSVGVAYAALAEQSPEQEEQFGGSQPLFELVGPSTAASVLLAALAAALAAVLWTAARPAAPDHDRLDEDDEDDGDLMDDEDDDDPDVVGGDVPAPDDEPEPDPYARYRRPG